MFGWVVIGREQTDKTYTNDLQTFFVSSEPENLQRFWEIEEVPAAQLWTAEEKRCDDHFKETTRRSPEGRFTVKLPFKNETKALGDSLQQARKRLHSLLFRLERQPDLYKRYAEFIGEFFHLKHMEKVPTSELVKPVENCYYLCHHCVFKESSTTTKLRVVFDGSAKTTTGISLNDRFMVGPKILKDLFSILVRFRLHQVAHSADIAKMYRQVELDKEDKDYHRLLWKDPNSEAIETFRMTRVTNGIASSSFHSIRPLQVLAEETTNNKLRLSLTTDMYVDDLLTGCEDSKAAEKLQDAIITLLASAGFDIRKWVSSDSKLVSRLAATFRETEDEKIIESEDYAIKTLGIRWNPNPDQFGFTVKLDKGAPFTKRQILSEVSRLFDPLGWLSPTTIQHKSFVQLLWMDKLSWDQPLSDPIVQQYLRLRAQLKDLEKIKSSTVLKPATKSDLQLHVFCDASTTAYAAVVFIRQETDNFIETKMLTAKTRVAPIKSVCVPRLELCAALLGAKLVEAVTNAISNERFPTPKVFAWSDSTVTIAWLRDYQRKWKTFVANRVAKIQEIIPAGSWKHVPTEDNPADCASRGLAAADLLDHKLCWNGPEWLRQPENAWPSLDILSLAGEETEKEVKVQSENVTMISSKLDNATLLMINRHSSIHKVKRMFTYVQRFISSIKRRIQSSKVKHRTTKMSERLKACSSTPKETTDRNESTSQPMIRTYNSVSLQGKDLYEGRLQLYSFIQRNFLHEYKIIRNQPTDDASNSSRDATQQDIQQGNKFTGP